MHMCTNTQSCEVVAYMYMYVHTYYNWMLQLLAVQTWQRIGLKEQKQSSLNEPFMEGTSNNGNMYVLYNAYKPEIKHPANWLINRMLVKHLCRMDTCKHACTYLCHIRVYMLHMQMSACTYTCIHVHVHMCVQNNDICTCVMYMYLENKILWSKAQM